MVELWFRFCVSVAGFAVAVCYDDEIDDDVFAERSAPKNETSDVGSVGGAPRVIGDL